MREVIIPRIDERLYDLETREDVQDSFNRWYYSGTINNPIDEAMLPQGFALGGNHNFPVLKPFVATLAEKFGALILRKGEWENIFGNHALEKGSLRNFRIICPAYDNTGHELPIDHASVYVRFKMPPRIVVPQAGGMQIGPSIIDLNIRRDGRMVPVAIESIIGENK